MDNSETPPFLNLPPPNFSWRNQPNPNWRFVPANFPPPSPGWPLPFPSHGFPLPPTGISPFSMPPPTHFPPLPPVQPSRFAANTNSFIPSPSVPPAVTEITGSLPNPEIQAPPIPSTDLTSCDNKTADTKTSTSSPDAPPILENKDLDKKTKEPKSEKLAIDKDRKKGSKQTSEQKPDHKEHRSSSKDYRDRSKSSRKASDDKRDKGHKQSHRSRSPPSHRSHRDRDSRDRKYDRDTHKRYLDRSSRSPSHICYKQDRGSRSSSHRDSERRNRNHSLESRHSRRRDRSRSRLSVHRRTRESRDPGHSNSRQVLEVGEKPPSKPVQEDQSCIDSTADQTNLEKNDKLEQKEIDCSEIASKETESRLSKEDKPKIREVRKEEKKSHRSHSNSSRKDVSKLERDRHSKVSPRPHKKSRHAHRNQVEDQPALSTDPTKHISCTMAEEFYSKTDQDSNEVVATEALKELHQKFQTELVERAERIRALKPKYEPPVRKTKLRKHKPPAEAQCSEDDSSCSSQESSSEEEDTAFEELERKRQHPDRLHPELWFNDPREMNDGPLCRCSAKARRSGIRHGIYVGEFHLPPCDPFSNNIKRLHHYKIAVSPVTNFLTKSPTVITHAGNKYIFEGFSLLSHRPISLKLPPCKVIRFNYEYTVQAVSEPMPCHFTVAGLELFGRFLLKELLELEDLDWRAHEDDKGCPLFHFFPRFARVCNDDSKELLSLNVILDYLLSSNQLLVPPTTLDSVNKVSDDRWQSTADKVKGMIITSPGMKPSAVRVDQLDREHIDSKLDPDYPVIVHFGVRPPQLSYAGNPKYQKAWREYVKYRHLLANKPKVTQVDRHKLLKKETKLQQMRMENDLKRDVTVVISSKGFYKTGIMSDIIQHAMLLPILVCHLRFHGSLGNLEETIGYKFKDRFLLQLALTHPSYRENFGTNPDHARNSLTNCGLRQPQYGDRRIHYMNTRKRGINTLINIMSRFGSQQEAASSIHHNERLEFLGDAVVEFLSSIHLFYLFPDLEEGGLATYRAAIVQNQHLAVLAKKLQLEKFMLYAHGSDLCHDLELRHAMANCFEALMGALFLDGGIEVADKVFSKTLFPEKELQEVWKNYPLHPLQEQEPEGDRKWIESVPLLQKLHKFEEQIGIEFTHIRLLARALTHRSLGYNNLTLGSNQRLEFLGDTVLQLVASEYLYKFFPQHHEGHLSLLRSSIVNNRTQAVVCKDLGMTQYAIYPYSKVELKPKDKADLLEAFLGALYVDKDLGYCRKFCDVCFFPRLQDFIMNQDWNDPKSKLQQCCLTLRSMDGGEPDIPTYKVIECKGPTNTRVYAVAVYFQGSRLAVGSGHSIQQAEMDAANNALMKSQDLFPQLKHQKRAIERSLKQGPPRRHSSKYKLKHRD